MTTHEPVYLPEAAYEVGVDLFAINAQLAALDAEKGHHLSRYVECATPTMTDPVAGVDCSFTSWRASECETPQQPTPCDSPRCTFGRTGEFGGNYCARCGGSGYVGGYDPTKDESWTVPLALVNDETQTRDEETR